MGLHLAAEFARDPALVRYLLQAGAWADIHSAQEIHIVENAMNADVRKLLSEITGHPTPPPQVERQSVKMSAVEWRTIKVDIDRTFDGLARSGLIVAQDAGQTQEDGFSDCTEIHRGRGGETSKTPGFCFYTRQDLNRAKRSSQLGLAFWSAPAGARDDMRRVGSLIVDVFMRHGFEVDWNRSAGMRPVVLLRKGL